MPLHYRERDLNDALRQFEIAFARSPDVNFFLEEHRVYFDWIQNPTETALSSMRLNWLGLPSVGLYRAILYADDENLK